MRELISGVDRLDCSGADGAGDDWSILASMQLRTECEPSSLVPANGERHRKEKDLRCIQRAQRLFETGHTHKAMEALSSTTDMADLNSDEERQKLRDLHPAPRQAVPQCPQDAPEIVVDWRWVQSEMVASDNGSAPGPSGYGSNYLSVLATDQHCVDALTFFIQQIVNNRLPDVLRTLLTTCVLVSFVKDNGGRRPIAIGDVFYRMAARYAVSLVSREVERKLSPHQYGVGSSDGCTQIVQSIQHVLSYSHLIHGQTPHEHKSNCYLDVRHLEPSPMTQRPMACLSIDMANAFNTIDRATILRILYSDRTLRRCWRAVAFGYGKPSLLLMHTHDSVSDDAAFIESRTGVRQGDPLAALLFSLAMHDVYDALAKKVSAGCYAFIDDGHFIGTIEECWLVWQSLPALLEPLGLSLNASKCELTCFWMQHISQDLDKQALEKFRSSPLKINDSSLRLLGCVVAVDDKIASYTLMHKHGSGSSAPDSDTNSSLRAAQQTALRRIPQLKKQTAMLALQRLSGIVINNQLRAMSPTATLEHARRYDKEVMRVAHALIGINKEDGQKYDVQIQSPLNMGGFGLTSAETIAPAAYIAGAENTMRTSPAFATMWNGSEPLPTSSPMYLALQESITRYNRLVSELTSGCDPKHASARDMPSLLPNSAESFISYFKTNPSSAIQSSLVHRISTLSFIARISAAEKVGKTGHDTIARLQSLREAGAALWLQTMPTEAGLTLSDSKWRWAARLRLGIPVVATRSACDRCKRMDAYTADSWHALSCTALSGRAMTDRHNNILVKLAQFATLAQLNTRTEPATLDRDTKKRPDIQVSLPDKTLLGDVTIAHPAARSWKQRACKHGTQIVGDVREAVKNDLYTEMATANDMEFTAVVLYTHGGFHQSALRFIQRITSALDPVTCQLSRSEFNITLRQHIAVAVQRGNADIMIQDEWRQRDSVSGARRIMRAYRNIRNTAGNRRQMDNECDAHPCAHSQSLPNATLDNNSAMDSLNDITPNDAGLQHTRHNILGVPLTASCSSAIVQTSSDVTRPSKDSYIHADADVDVEVNRDMNSESPLTPADDNQAENQLIIANNGAECAVRSTPMCTHHGTTSELWHRSKDKAGDSGGDQKGERHGDDRDRDKHHITEGITEVMSDAGSCDAAGLITDTCDEHANDHIPCNDITHDNANHGHGGDSDDVRHDVNVMDVRLVSAVFSTNPSVLCVDQSTQSQYAEYEKCVSD